MMTGWLLFEYAWKELEGYRLRSKQPFNNDYPPFKRLDTHNWSRIKLMPGSVLVLPARFVLMHMILIIAAILCKICLIGQDMSKPFTPFRRAFTKRVVILASKAYLITTFTSLSVIEKDCDYSKWLGPDYKQNKPQFKRVSTILSNHVTLIDVLILCSQENMPAFAAKGGLENVPVAGILIRCVQGIFLPRTGTAAER